MTGGADPAALRASEARFRALIDAAPDAMLIVDRAGRIVLVNRRAEQLFGYRRSDLLGAPVELLLPESLRAIHQKHRLQYHGDPLTRPMGIGLDLTARRKDGTAFAAEISLSPVETSEGPVVTAVIRDVSERARAEEERVQLALAEAARAEAEAARRRMEFLAEASAVLSASLDYEITLRSVARLAVPYLADWCAVDVVAEGATMRRIAVVHQDPIKEKLAAEWYERHPIRLDARDGVPEVIRRGRAVLHDPIPSAWIEGLPDLGLVSVMIVPITTRQGTVGAISLVTAESGRHYAPTDRVLAEDLARRSSLAIENARLYREAEAARAEAEAANRAKDEFLAILSHELRTPLTAMLGWVRMVRSGQLDPDRTARALETIERNTRVQTQLINDLLDVSRIIAGKLKLEMAPVDFAGIIEDAVASASGDAGAKGVALSAVVDPAVGPVLGDPTRLQQIVGNLVSNAIKFTSAGGTVDLSLAVDGDRARFVVADTGAGIDADLLPRIFEPFRQADSSATRRHGGLGLGLAIVRYLTELHGGTVTAASDGIARGATFTVALPLCAEHAETVAPAPTAVSARAALPSLDGIRVLVVEDDADTRELVTDVLSRSGASVTSVGTVREALAALGPSRFDVLVSDLGMPGEDGYDLIRELRRVEDAGNRPAIPAIALTAFATADDRARALAAGFQVHAAKPITPMQLAETVARAARA